MKNRLVCWPKENVLRKCNLLLIWIWMKMILCTDNWALSIASCKPIYKPLGGLTRLGDFLPIWLLFEVHCDFFCKDEVAQRNVIILSLTIVLIFLSK
jgi:hypothetical protein